MDLTSSLKLSNLKHSPCFVVLRSISHALTLEHQNELISTTIHCIINTFPEKLKNPMDILLTFKMPQRCVVEGKKKKQKQVVLFASVQIDCY